VKDVRFIVKYSSEQRLTAASAKMSVIAGTLSAQYPYRLLRLRKASIRARSCAEVRPDHADEQ